MSLNARFSANFDEFKKAVTDADTHLMVFERGTKRAAAELTRLEESYSGQRIVAQAILSAEAVSRIGGTTKLTSAELRSLGDMAEQAVAKLKKMGQEIPPELQRVASAAKMAREETGRIDATGQMPGLQAGLTRSSAGAVNLTSVLGRLGVAAAGAFSVRAVLQFTVGLADAADKLAALHDRTGLEIEALQVLSGVAERGNVSIETLAKGSNNLAKGLKEDSEKVREGLKDLGLGFDEIRAMKPDERLAAIARAYANIDDQGTRASVATRLFKGAGEEMLAVLTPGFAELQEKIRGSRGVLDALTIQTLSDAKNAVADLGNNLKVGLSKNLADIILLLKNNPIDRLMGLPLASELDEVNKGLEQSARAWKAIQDARSGLSTQAEQDKAGADAIFKMHQELAKVQRLDLQKQIMQLHELGQSNKEIAETFGVTERAIDSVIDRWDRLAKSEDAMLERRQKQLVNKSGAIEIGPGFGEGFGRLRDLDIGKDLIAQVTGTRDLVSANIALKEASEALAGAYFKATGTTEGLNKKQQEYLQTLRALQIETQRMRDSWVAPAATDDPIEAARRRSEETLRQVREQQAAGDLTWEQMTSLEAAELERANVELITLQANMGKVTAETDRSVQKAHELVGVYQQVAGALSSAAALSGGGATAAGVPMDEFGNFDPWGWQRPRRPAGVLPGPIPRLAEGALVRGPQLAMIGEREPELVIPLSRFAGGGGGGSIVVNNNFSGLLLSSDPAARHQLKQAVDEATFGAVKRGKKV